MAEPTDPKKTEGTSQDTGKVDSSELAKGFKKVFQEEEIAANRAQKARELLLQTETELQQIYKESLDLLKEKERSTEAIRQYSQGLADSEQIIKEAEEKHLEAVKEQYLIRQKAFVLAVEEIRELKEKQKTSFGLTQDEIKRLELLEKKILPNLRDQTSELGKQIQDIEKRNKLEENFKNLGSEILENLKQQGLALEKHIMNLSVANGGYAGLLSNLREAGRLSQAATLGTGITGEENQKALEGLSKSFIGLTTYSAESISSMQVATAQLGKLGVDAGIAGKGMDSLVNAMGKTPQQAAKIQESFVQMAAKNRLALGAVSQAFAENSSRFVGYGEQMTKVLDGLAEQSLKTGIAIGKLVAIAQQFDTFEGAAKAVGNLNALLGGDYFNSIELLTASDEERIKLLKDGVAASGIQWESMNRFQKMAIANAAGISDLNEASKLFGKTSLENTKQQAEAAAVQKTLAEQAASVSLAYDKLKSSFNGLFIAIEPLVEGFILLGGALAKLVYWINVGFSKTGLGSQMSAVLTSITMVAISLAAYIGYLAIKNRILGGSWNFVATSIARASAALARYRAQASLPMPNPPSITRFSQGPATSATGAVTQTTQVANRTAFSMGNIVKAAGALLLFAGALLLFGLALNQFKQFVQGEGQMGAVGVMVASIVGLLGVAKLLSKSTAEVSKGMVVLLVMSVAIGALGLALNLFTKFDWKMIAGVGLIILGFALSIAALGAIFTNPITSAALAAGIIVILVIAAAFALLGIGLVKVVESIDKASKSLANLASSFKQLFEIKNLKDNFSSLESFLSQLSDIDYDPINQLAQAIGLLATNMERLSSISSIMNVKGSAEMSTVQNIKSTAEEVGKTANNIGTNLAQKSLIPVQQTTAFVPLIVQMDKTTVIKILEKDIRSIAYGEAQNALDAAGLTQTSFEVSNRVYGGTG